jgi:competence ComEA-like helix-hairpin-helix protein
LEGEQSWRDISLQLAADLPEGCAEVTLMLREWTDLGYVTRDYRTLQVAKLQTAAAAPEVKVPTEPLPKASAKTKVKAATKKATAPAAPSKVSINEASVEALAGIKGLPVKVAEAIVAARPFASLEDLRRVKGMGDKLLAKLRNQFSC